MVMLSRERQTPASVRLIRSQEAERVPHTGAVTSVQEARVTLPRPLLDELWKRENLERLARAYWRHVTRATLGVIRIVYERDAPVAVLFTRRVPLLRFHAPEYETSADRGRVTWRIERGLLVARAGRDQGFLRIIIRRQAERPPGSEARLEVQLEVRNFYPWLRGSGRFARFGAWLYGQTQLRIHVFICNAFLRSLGRLELPPARVDGRAQGLGSGPGAAV